MSVVSIPPLRPGARVLVAGAGMTGRSVLAALEPLGVQAVLTDDRVDALTDAAHGGVEVLDAAAAAARIAEFDLVVTSPGLPPQAPVPAAAAAAGVPVWGDVELAWRLDAAGHYGPPRRWLVVTGTNGKTTTTSMLHAMLVADGRRAALCGNIGRPVIDVLAGSARLGGGGASAASAGGAEGKPGPAHGLAQPGEPADFLAIELSSFQLYWAPSVRPVAGAVLNVAEDHLDWHGSMAGYAAAKAVALSGRVAVAGIDDPTARDLLEQAPAPVKVGFTLDEPQPGQLGVSDGMLVDRAFADAAPLARTDVITVAGPVGVLDALAAAALARAVGVAPDAIAAALEAFEVGRHRAELVGVIDGVAFVDDSKATNPHAAEASLLAYQRAVWVAGGLLKGASVDELVARVAGRLAGAVLIGRDRDVVAKALSRHAPDVPVIHVVTGEDAGVQETSESGVTHVVNVTGAVTGPDIMTAVVGAARELARPGDTVLLAPAGASFDQFTGYAARGDAFAAAVADLGR
ncbi:MAG: UDP-N-acetylmuramoyl-L-alanine--D-glutamate ligase [Mycolicibacterium sp.]|uniref:UDP-N-acetylmuramoylalanine--D-glutamate ligase n=1 Tax=Mycolicibacterium insubricum TaxID=444597 RepID=A0A1X0DKP2_9MYCO|nr:UDP-N-acetylmuramoyl-L-alanine--D-glutamate ligase [Mycolicibacterium insubricum]MCB9441342.1 UDP-N-acetylmuramoyl-L-alanine--D-glutamate ligase [Mycolicibacterium sp.]ORA72420.1 UDP-N-acetylmuramoyl-L-alanine--D-glutamate ligase [Mycolicibacterium insubricum]